MKGFCVYAAGRIWPNTFAYERSNALYRAFHLLPPDVLVADDFRVLPAEAQ